MKIQKPISNFPEYLYTMLTYNNAYRELIAELNSIYDKREAAAIANIVMEEITGLDRLQRVIERDKILTENQTELHNDYIELLKTGTPIQYCTNKAVFMDNEYYVDNRVLIPRPETEELVQWVIDDYKNKNVDILDIGTGSGCIPISLKLALSNSSITSIDISHSALQVAKENATALNSEISFIQADFLDENSWSSLNRFDIIISNPPYIPNSEKENMHINVKDHEPSEALFVPNENPLIFYNKIALFGKKNLKKNGSIYCELHLDHALQTKTLFEHIGYASLDLRKDMNGNWRMLKATL